MHLLAAGAWLGGLPMLALLFHRALAAATAEAYEVAREATRRFSVMGLIAVAALLATGIVNTWYLAGSLPALVGTDYGRWLLLKVAMFGAMVAVAAVNRQALTPRLALESNDSVPPGARMALRMLRRNSLLEAALGIGVIAIVAWLGSAVPGAHQQAEWPFSVRYNGAAFTEPEFRAGLWLAIAAVVLALGLVVAGYMLRRWRVGATAIALVIIPFALSRFAVLVTEAYPTSFFNSPTGYTAHSVAVGARAFAQNCVACHGPEGKGDGPLARSLPVPPADLTAAHVYGHLPGDLYWTIGHGVPGTPMPGFVAKLDAQTRWSLVDFILANADGARTKAGTPAQVPDFPIECPGGAVSSLRASPGHIIDLVFGDSGVAERIAVLTSLDLGADVTMVVATDRSPPAGACAARADDLAVSLALYISGSAQRISASEFLIDGNGWLRETWLSPPDAATLRRTVTMPEADACSSALPFADCCSFVGKPVVTGADGGLWSCRGARAWQAFDFRMGSYASPDDALPRIRLSMASSARVQASKTPASSSCTAHCSFSPPLVLNSCASSAKVAPVPCWTTPRPLNIMPMYSRAREDGTS